MELQKLLWNSGATAIWDAFMNNKLINFMPMIVMPFKSDRAKFSKCMEFFDLIVKPESIVTFQKYLDKNRFKIIP